MNGYAQLLTALASGGVEFILVGGLAATAHGSARLTQDVDVVYRRTAENVARLADAVRPLSPYLRGAPPGLPFRWDSETIARGLNFTLTTTHGYIDLLGEITGGGGYEQLLPHSLELELYGIRLRCIDLESLIRVKRAAGRPKDLDALSELEAMREDQDRQG